MTQLNIRSGNYIVVTLERDHEAIVMRSDTSAFWPWQKIIDVTGYDANSWENDPDAPRTMLWDSRFRTKDGVWKAAIQHPSGPLD